MHYLHRSARRCLCFLVVAGTWSAVPASGAAAAEIQLRAQAQPGGRVVVLGDVATVYAANEQEARQLEAVELLPSPAPGDRRYLRLREVQDLLRAQGVNLVPHRFSGSGQVVIAGAAPASRNRSLPGRFARGAARRVETEVQQAVTRYLQAVAPDKGAWQVRVMLTPDQVRQLAAARGQLQVAGGTSPWLGTQSMVVRGADRNEPFELPIEAVIRLPQSVVVAKGRIAPGAVIRATDVELRPPPPGSRGQNKTVYRFAEEVIGKETTRAIPVGQAFDQTALRRPVLVRRNDVVTVYARTAGIVVRTVARAREDGSSGDLIEAESLSDRRKYYVRVTGLGEVDVLAYAVRPASAP